VSFYLDASFVLSLFAEDSNSELAEVWIANNRGKVAISTWAEAEFFAVLGRWRRSGRLSDELAAKIVQDFEAWKAETAAVLDTVPEAGMRAAQLTKNPVLKLAAPDALHLAIAMLNGLTLVTFDTRLADAAKALSHPAVVP
jgi:uncharacterized protein